MRQVATTTIYGYVTEFASPKALMDTSYAAFPITFLRWLELERERISSADCPAEIVAKGDDVALAYVSAKDANLPAS